MNEHDMVAAISSLFPAAHYTVDYTLNVTASGATLLTWNNALGAQPTQAQIQAALDSIQLSGYQKLQSNVIESAYQNATYNVPVSYMGTTFFTDTNSQAMLAQALVVFNQAGAVPSNFAWWDSNDKSVAMTLAQLQGLAQAIATAFYSNFVKRKTLLANIAAATTAAAVQAIVW